MTADHQRFLDAQKTTTRCAFCKWKYVGPAGEGRLKAEEHRRDEHPERAPGGKLAEAFERRKRRRKPWSRQEIGEAFARFEEEFERPAKESDIPLCPYLPSMNSTMKVCGSWRVAVELGRKALAARLSGEEVETYEETVDPPAAPEEPRGRATRTVPKDAPSRLRAALHELADAVADVVESDA
jgi:hypothetical protein